MTDIDPEMRMREFIDLLPIDEPTVIQVVGGGRYVVTRQADYTFTTEDAP